MESTQGATGLMFGLETSRPRGSVAFEATTNHTAKTTALILASSHGAALAAEMGSANGGKLTKKALLPVHDALVVEHWLNAIARCDGAIANVLIAHNKDDAAAFEAWAASGAMPANASLVCAENAAASDADADARGGIAADLLHVAESAAHDRANHLLVIDGEHVPEPDYDLRSVLDHARSRGKDVFTFVDVDFGGEGATPSEHVLLKLRDNGAGGRVTFPEVLGAAPYPDASAWDGNTAALGPVTFLRRGTTPLVRAFFDTVAPSLRCAASERFGHLMSYVQCNVIVHALEMKHAFSVKTLGAYEHACDVFKFYAEEKEKASAKFATLKTGGVGAARDDARAKILREKIHARTSRAGDYRLRAVAAEADMDVVLSKYNAMKASENMTESFAKRLGIPGAVLPPRFADAAAWKLEVPKQHACYATSANVYGAKRVTPADMPMRWHGVKGDFTDRFGGAMYKDDGLVVGIDKSNVHRALDGII
ncbi:uncharacterized protein MICPUCDRAFT_39965 [Micromonas pusilla CCMP1545]|uniref:Predicted protein n=1 Tax=Micromonas pusilla (strain CCMP1545) TaxID=564608 RepID=C1MS98_MICPC|nr:uncharacterized protein MICPUCDRAFT_39965 [Micromonas pusilla CCMP1545]EEH57100.1 predicted protein [Micromonas pusilla CCMP1545]|eukprot:XP_003058645.1 predicted protein [Micromonas pusilla CCMP1545]